ncbi:MAG: Hsp33 family molecular chaperone HslO [Desulfobulbaceae bacterium]|jgi:molecular chaperone Hsp33|nr:Hsp33 family molecular chaperone HslO [Desulfobulbaceae bacterium]
MMRKTDSLTRILADDGGFFALACVVSASVSEACRRHDCGPLAAIALGRAISGAALLAALLKDGQHVQLKFEGNGPLGKIIAEAGYDGWLRGYVANPQAEAPLVDGRLSVAMGLGRAGFLTVKKFIGLPQAYQGIAQLRTSEIGEDIAWYLLESEQKPSYIALSALALPDRQVLASGLLVQPLPGAAESTLAAIEKALAAMPPLSDLLKNDADSQTIAARLGANIAHHQTAAWPLCYECGCSPEKMRAALLTLGATQIRELLVEERGAEARCEFCRQCYQFSEEELRTLLAAIEASAPSR